MSKKFKNILVPVDFSINTEVAVRKAIEFSGEGTTIHLLNVQMDLFLSLSPRTYQYLIDNTVNSNRDVVNEQLEQWKRTIEACAKVMVCTWIVYDSSVTSVIEKKAVKLKADLIIIGKNSHHSWFPFLNTVVPSIMAERTKIPVLTVKPGSLHNKVQKVIVPVTAEVGHQKRELIDSLCNKFNAQVHLVTFMDEGTPSDLHVSALLATYQQLKMNPAGLVEYNVLHGKNKAKELLRYAGTIGADLLLVHPQTETKISWRNSHISDVLPADSKIQVLAIQPQSVGLG